MNRGIDKTLLAWKSQIDRKPILLIGARQTGKSFSVEKLGSQFHEYVKIDFEKMPSMAGIFAKDLDPNRIVREISAVTGKKVLPGETLLFLDEIQNCPHAISSLRYFKEDLPELHLIGAGSLIEFDLEKISIPVGRVRFLHVGPFTFFEFLEAIGHSILVQEIRNAGPTNPLPAALHAKALDLLRDFLFIGGMPEVVKTFAEKNSIVDSMNILYDILATYRADFGKYATRKGIEHLSKVFEVLPKMVGQHVKYSKIDPDLLPRDLKKAVDLLEKAHILNRIKAAHHIASPLEAGSSEKQYKVLFLDIGLLQRAMGVEFAQWKANRSIMSFHAGAVAEQYAGQELQIGVETGRLSKLYFWHRAQPGSTAELDYLAEIGGAIVPMEIKAGAYGHLKSLNLFLEQFPFIPFGLKISEENFGRSGKVVSVPLYAAGNIPQILGKLA